MEHSVSCVIKHLEKLFQITISAWCYNMHCNHANESCLSLYSLYCMLHFVSFAVSPRVEEESPENI